MTLTDIEVARLRRLLWEIRKETHGRCRGLFVDNKLDKISLMLRKAERRTKRQSNERIDESKEQTHS